MSEIKKVLVVGGTGLLGGRVIYELLRQGKQVRALIRPYSNTSHLNLEDVEVVRGDLKNYRSLLPAVSGVDALITTAAGYGFRQKGDSLDSVDDKGNKNLIHAAEEVKLRLFVFTSILSADRAVHVPHFYQKKIIEDYLEIKQVPYVSIRPAGMLETMLNPHDIAKKGRILSVINPEAQSSVISMDDVAKYLVNALDEPNAKGKKIDISADRPVSWRELAEILSEVTGMKVSVKQSPRMLSTLILSVAGLFSPLARMVKPSMDFVESGDFIADTSLQRRLFGNVPTVEDSIKTWVENVLNIYKRAMRK